MREGEIEETVIPQNPLDVLAQHLVSMAALDEWEVDEVERLVTATEPFHDLSREQLENVLDMLDGRYPSDRFAELRPRIVWDRTEGTMHGRKGARQLVVTNAGTIPDRGLYGVHLPDGRRVGELDEEMVYEARPGQTFLLGATTWRIEEITRDRVIVTPAPGVPGAVPFWKGDGIGRPAELGRAIGAFAREAVSRDPERAGRRVRPRPRAPPRTSSPTCASSRRRPASSPPTRRSSSSASATRSATGASASSRPTAAASTPPGAWRSPPKIRDERDLEADAIWSDDGIVIHLPDADEPPPADLVLIEPDELEDLVVAELSGSALFGARFRENAARSLLIPRAYPGKRTPLWQQRLKSQSLLEVARDFPRFPVILETYRECLRDVLDLPSLAELLRELHSRQLSLVEVETPTASPFASSLLFDYVATYMYEGDTPNAERRAAALALDRDLLRELLGQEELRELIDPEALEEVEAQLQHRTEAGRAGDRDALQQVLRNLGDLTAEECEERVAEGYSADLDAGEAGRRAPRRRGPDRRRGALHRRRGRRPLPRRARRAAAGRACRRPSSRSTPTRCAPLVRRYARTHGPFPTAQLAARYGVDPTAGAARARARRGAGPRRAAAGRHRARVVRLRRPAPGPPRQPRPPAHARSRPPTAASSPASCRAGRTSTPTAPPAPGLDRLREALVPLQGVALTPKVWEARRAAAPARRLLARPGSTSSAPAASWSGSAPAPSAAATAASPSTSARTSASPARRPPTRSWSRPRARSTTRSASGSPPARRFWLDLLADLDHPAEELHNALWDLAWAGEVTNDAFAPLRAPRLRAVAAPRAPRPPLRPPPLGRRRRRPGPLVADRAAVRQRARRPAPRLRAQAELMLERYGIVTRETVLAEGVPGGFSTLYARARQPRAARHRPPRLLRRGPRRRPVRPPRRGRAAALAARSRRLLPGARRHRPGQPLRRLAALAEARGRPPPGARPRRPRAAARRRAGRLRRARRPRHPPPRRARRRRAGGGDARPRRRGRRRPPAEARDREARRRAGDRLRPRGGAARRRLQPRPAQTDRLGLRAGDSA